jgi:hypothetical protein
MKFLLGLLLLGNAGLFAYHQGYLAEIFPDAHEPWRMAGLQADKVRQISAEQANTLANGTQVSGLANPSASGLANTLGNTSAGASGETGNGPQAASATLASTPPAPPPATPTTPVAPVCLDVGDFSVADAKRFEAELRPLALGERQARRNVQEVSQYVVQIPPLGSKEAADKKAGELRGLKVTDFYIINDPNSPLRWSISLGVFKIKAAAQSHLEILNSKGVRSAVLATRSGNTSKVAFQLKGMTPELLGKFDAIKAHFPEQQSKPCKAAAPANAAAAG